MRGNSSIALITVGTFRVVSTKYLGRQHMFGVRNMNFVPVNFFWSLSFLSVARMHVRFPSALGQFSKIFGSAVNRLLVPPKP